MLLRTPLLILGFTALTSALSAQTIGGTEDLRWRVDGNTYFTLLGSDVSAAGDVNGDGFDDVLVGAWAAVPSGGFAATGSAFVYSGLDGSLLYRLNGVNDNDQFGNAVAAAGDVDGDGFADFIVGAPVADPNGITDSGSVFVYSGRLGTQIRSYHGLAISDALGFSVANAGDVDLDGVPDILIGVLGADVNGFIQVGSAFVYSGATSALLYRFDGEADFDDFSYDVANAGDVDGDGIPDFLIGSILADPGGRINAGSAFVYSGATGSQLLRLDGQFAGDELGNAVAGAGDVNGDGFDDLIVGAFLADPNGISNAGSVFVYSGATGAILHRFDGAAADDFLGFSVAGVGDIDHDGFDDVMYGDSHADPNLLLNAGTVRIRSGATGAEIMHFDGTTSNDFFGRSIAAAGDVDGDGRMDFVVGSDQTSPNGLVQAGSAFVYSFNPILTASATTLSLAAGGTVDLQIDFPDVDGFLDYAVLVSLQGTGPTSVQGLLVPLSMDGFLRDSLNGVTPSQGLGFQGTLSRQGKALAQLSVAPGSLPSSLLGRRLYLAVVNRFLDVSSVAWTIRFVP